MFKLKSTFLPLSKLKIENLKTFYFVSFLYQLARTLPHSIIVIFLIDKFTLEDSFALYFQMAFYLPILLFEVFSGYLADKFSTKIVFLLSVIFMAIGFSIIGFSIYLPIIFLGYIFYGFSAALFSGTLDVTFLNKIKEKYLNDKKSINNYISNIKIFTLLGMALGGLLGSFIYFFIGNYLFIISTVILILVFLIVFLCIKKSKPTLSDHKNFFTSFKAESVKTIKKTSIILFILISISFFVLGYYSLWPLLYENNGLDTIYLGLIYFTFQIIGVIAVSLFKKNDKLWFFMIFFSLLFFIFLLIFAKGLTFLILFPFGIFGIDYFKVHLDTQLMKKIDIKNSSIQISIISSFVNMINILSVLLIGLVIQYNPNIQLILSIVASISLVLVLFAYAYTYMKKKFLKNSKSIKGTES